MKRWLVLLVFLGSLCLLAQSFKSGSTPKNYLVGFYNVENLFDTINDPTSGDDDFTPHGKNKWDTKKYKIKLNNLAKVISSFEKNNLPIVVGFAEIENKQVLTDLIQTKALSTGKYGIIHRNSPDERGIDVAAIYRMDVLTEVSYEFLTVKLPDEKDKTRDILYLKAKSGKKNTLHIFYNHWPSRREGEKESEPKRIAAAKVLKAKVDAVLSTDASAQIIVMGDFNDEPKNKSIAEILGAGKENESGKKLINLSLKKAELGEGTHAFKGEWNMLDQAMVSSGLYAGKTGFQLSVKEVQIFKPEWILFTHKDGNQSPSKSYSGTTFHKTGYSDHLPIYVSLTKKK